jgi:type VI secretion system secreted protein VgrG
MALFAPALTYLLNSEGGRKEDPNDPGGRTNRGVTARNLVAFNRAHPEFGLPDDPWELSIPQTATFYRYAGYWSYDGVASQRIATKLLDSDVLLGDATCVKMVQVLLGTKADGLWGPATEAALNAEHEDEFLAGFVDALVCRYAEIVAKHPSDQEYLAGWDTRARRLPDA